MCNALLNAAINNESNAVDDIVDGGHVEELRQSKQRSNVSRETKKYNGDKMNKPQRGKAHSLEYA